MSAGGDPPGLAPHPRGPAADPGLAAFVGKIGAPRILVIGDLILDRYTWGDAERISPEAPVIVLRSDRCEHRLGGAAGVAQMLRGLGARVALAGVVGDDPEGEVVRRLLDASAIGARALVGEAARPTTVKERLMGRAQYRHAHQILRVDREGRAPLPLETRQALARRLLPLIAEHDLVLVSDYAKGVCGPELLAEVFARARAEGKRVLVDPARGVPLERYRGASCLTPNRLEATEATGVAIERPADALEAGRALRARLDLEAAIVTLDRDGMALVLRDGEAALYPTRPRPVYDITGAGDMVLSVLGVCLAEGADFDQAVRLANVAGGLEVEKVGAAPVTWAEIVADLSPPPRTAREKVLPLPALVRALEARRRDGHRIVMTNGCFDLLHPGHLRALEEAAALGDCLVVGLNSDASVRRLKGPGRPILDQDGRAALLAGLEAVAYVTLFDDDTPLALVRAVRPDVLVKGGTYAPHEVVGRDVVEGYGGTVVLGRILDGWSTTALLRRLRERDAFEDSG